MPQHEIYSLAQIEPGSLKNFAAQLKEGAAAARQLRPQYFCPPCSPASDRSPHDLGSRARIEVYNSGVPQPGDRFLVATAKVYDLTLVTADERLMRVPGIRVLANR